MRPAAYTWSNLMVKPQKKCFSHDVNHVVQEYAIDFQAISLAFAAVIVGPLPSMSRHKPPPSVGALPSYVLVAMMVLLFTTTDIFAMLLLTTRSWFHGGDGTSSQASHFSLHQ